MIRRPPRSTLDRSSAASDVYKRQIVDNLEEYLSMSKQENLEFLDQLYHLMNQINADAVDYQGLKIHHAPPLCPDCLLYTSPSPRDRTRSRMPSSA